MKKFYSLFAAAALAVSVNAQTTVNYEFGNQGFSNAQAISGGTIDANLSYTTASGSSLSDPSYYTADGLRLYSVRATGDGNTLTITPSNGAVINTLVVEAFSTAYAPTMKYSVDGGTFQNATLSGTTYTISGINSTSSLTIKNAHTGGSSNIQLRIPSFSVTYAIATMNVIETSSLKNKFVKNTSISDVINFGTKSEVTVFNSNGEAVKKAFVSENKNLNVSDLTPGIYIVAGTVEGKKVSQKILKK